MTSIAQDSDAVIELIDDALASLRAKYPDHELLRFADELDKVQPSKEYCDRFRPKSAEKPTSEAGPSSGSSEPVSEVVFLASIHTEYYLAIREAIGLA